MKHAAKRRSLITEYLFILALVCIILLSSFLATGYIADHSAEEKARQSSEVIFGQAIDQMESFEEDIDNLYTNIVYNHSVLSYIMADTYPDRQRYLEDFYRIVGSNRRINKNILNIALYDERENLIASKGDLYLPPPVPFAMEKLINYTGRQEHDGKNYFEVGMPVYNKEEGIYQKVGSVMLLFDTNALQRILEAALINEEAAIAILDQKGNVIVQAGSWKSGRREGAWEAGKEECLIYEYMLDASGWKLKNVIPRNSLLSEVSQMKRINDVTYSAVVLAVLLICFMIYRRVIQPIRRQTAFMAGFKEDVRQRIEIIENNEIGEMAAKMNQMLDDIESLNRQILETQKQNLELQYAKKQTEMIACKNQMNPHFLYNTLDCVRGMALFHGEQEIAQLIQSLSRLFRYNVKGDEWVSVREVTENLREYARIIECRFMGRHTICLSADESVLSRKIPKMLVQPLLENAVLHGLEKKIGDGQVDVQIREHEKSIWISIQDTGCGMSKEKVERLNHMMQEYDRSQTISEKEEGIGFLNVYRRIRLFYREQAKVQIKSMEGEGTTIEILLPME